jgi:hypothetical protein
MAKNRVHNLVTKTARTQQEIEDKLPGMRPTHDRFCLECNNYLRVGQPDCVGHTIRKLNPREAEAATMDNLLRWD